MNLEIKPDEITPVRRGVRKTFFAPRAIKSVPAAAPLLRPKKTLRDRVLAYYGGGPYPFDVIERANWPTAASSYPTINSIQRIVSRHYGVSQIDIISSRRTAKIVFPRQIAMYLSRVLTPRSLPEIGRRFGGKDHTTVLHSVHKITSLIANDAAVSADISALRKVLERGRDAALAELRYWGA